MLPRTRKFLTDAADTFVVAAGAVILADASTLFEVGSWEQAAVVAVALGRAAIIAGVKAVVDEARRDEP